MRTPRSAEGTAFLRDIADTDPSRVTACPGWTAHEVTAHVTGTHVEVIRHLDPFLQGYQVPRTRSFEEREAPLRAMDHDTLLRRLDEDEARMRRLVDEVLHRDADAIIPWTGRQMAVAKFIPHLRNEHALHRWDVIGEDAESQSLLGQHELVDHSVGELGRILMAAGRQHDPAPDDDFAVELRSDPEPPLVASVRDGEARLRWPSDGDPSFGPDAVVEIDPMARHLFIWGRRPDRHDRIRSRLAPAALARLQALLSGY